MRDHPGWMLTVALSFLMPACGPGGGDAVTPPLPDRRPVETSTSAGAGGDRRWIVLPDSAGRMPADSELGCPSGPTFPASALDEIRPLSGSGLEEIEPAMRGFLDGEEGGFWPQDDWQILHQTGDWVLLMHVTQPDGSIRSEISLAFMTIERADGGWRWGGAQSGGPCPLRTILPGLNTVEWRVDRSAGPLGPDSTRIVLLLTERECVGGQPLGDRLLGPEIVMTESSALIAFAAEPPPGGMQTCPGNPEQSVVVELPEPLGNREVSDGLAIAGHLEDFVD